MQSQAEQQAAEAAKAIVDARTVAGDPGTGFKFIPGKPLPDGFINPLPGEHLHRCVDLKGNYAPDWFAFFLRRDEGMQERIPFGDGNGKLTIRTGVWCDVPPHLVNRIASMYEEIKEMRPTRDPSQLAGGEVGMVLTTVRKNPTFSYNSRQSA